MFSIQSKFDPSKTVIVGLRVNQRATIYKEKQHCDTGNDGSEPCSEAASGIYFTLVCVLFHVAYR